MPSKGAPKGPGQDRNPVTVVENPPQKTVTAALASAKKQVDAAAKK